MSCLKKWFIAAAGVALALPGLALTGFDTDYSAAQARAKASGRRMFVLFTGSDWCIWCKRLEKEVLSQSAFLDFATNEYELVAVDFPQRKKQPAAQRKSNEALSRKFHIEGFPTILLIDGDEKVVHKAGYEAGGAAHWVERFKEDVALKPLYNEHLASFENRMDALEEKLSERFSALHKSAGADERKMLEGVKALAGEFLPEVAAIKKEFEAKTFPAELEKAKGRFAAQLGQMHAWLEEQAKLDVREAVEKSGKRQEEKKEKPQ